MRVGMDEAETREPCLPAVGSRSETKLRVYFTLNLSDVSLVDAEGLEYLNRIPDLMGRFQRYRSPWYRVGTNHHCVFCCM